MDNPFTNATFHTSFGRNDTVTLGVKFDQGESMTLGTSFNQNNRVPLDYNKLFNKPVINGQTIEGDLLLSQLGLRAIYYDTTASWNAQPGIVSEEGALYIYNDYKVIEDEVGNRINVPGIRIGDGTTYLIDLPFLSDNSVDVFYSHINNTSMHVSESDRIFWNNKVSSYLDGQDTENLVLSKDYYVINGDIMPE